MPFKKRGAKRGDKLSLIPDQSKLVPVAGSEEMTPVPYDPFQRYLFEIGQYHLLTKEEEKMLFIGLKDKKDRKAAYKLTTSNLRLVVRIALDLHRYWSKSILDLIQEGNVGLLKAVRKFDPYRGVKFSYYAAFWIRAYILKFIMDNFKLIKIGTTRDQRKLFYNLIKDRKKLISQGLSPEPRLLAERLDVKEEMVVEMSQRLGESELSLNYPMGEDSREFYGDRLCDPAMDIEEQLSIKQLQQMLIRNLHEFHKTLTEREADIFDNRIMAEEPLTLRELGGKYHISRERVRQIQIKIIKNVKKWLKQKIPNIEEEYSNFQR